MTNEQIDRGIECCGDIYLNSDNDITTCKIANTIRTVLEAMKEPEEKLSECCDGYDFCPHCGRKVIRDTDKTAYEIISEHKYSNPRSDKYDPIREVYEEKE